MGNRVSFNLKFGGKIQTSYFRFEWIRTNVILGESEAEVRWFVPNNQEDGIYRITHYGNQKDLLRGTIVPYSGTTNQFEVTTPEIRQRIGQIPKKIRPNLFRHLRRIFQKHFSFFGF